MVAGNALTSSGFNQILSQVFDATDTRSFQYFIIGAGTTTPTTTDTGLESTITAWTAGGTSFKAYLTKTLDPANEGVNLRAFITAAEATGNVITEYADVNALATKVLLGRFVFVDAITKTDAVQLSIITKYRRG